MSLRRTRDEIHTADAGSRHGSQRRPASIGELADRAIKFEWDASRDFKHCLRTAEGCRNQARAYQNAGDLEMAFVYFARAATIALEKLPAHPQFKTALTEAQRDNLGLNGQEILDCMGSIKPTLVERFNKWRAVHPDSPLLPLFDDQEPPSAPYDSKLTKALKDEAAAWREARETREREAEEDHFRQHQIEEENLQRQSSRHRPNVQRQPTMDPRRQDSIRLAGPPAYKPSAADYAFSQPPNPGLGHGSQSTKVVVMPPASAGPAEASQRKREREEKRRAEQEGIARRLQEADAEARQIRQTIAVNNSRPQHQGSSTLSAHSSVSSVATNGSSPMFPHTQASSLATTPASSFYQAPHMSMSMPPQPVIHPQSQAQQMAAPPAVSMPVHSAPPPQNMNPARVLNVPPPPPLSHMASPPVADQHQQQYQHQQQQQQQQPAPYHPGSESPNPPFMFPGSSLVDLHRTPTRATVRSQVPQGFSSTTSPPPQDPRALFPSLMSPHQQQQGYYPSHYSMFTTAMDRLTLNDTTNTTPATAYPSNNIYAPSNQPNPNVMPWAAFGSQESAKSAAAAAAARVGRGLMDGSGGAGLRKSGTAKYHSPAPPPPGTENAPASSSSSVPYIPMPPPPPSAAAGLASTAGRSHPSHLERDRRQQSVSHSRHHPGSSPKERKLKPVVLPREILPRFLAIASLNTSINIETCGLLLGREVWPDGDEGGQQQHHNSSPRGGGEGRSEYMVTTLLVPRQRGTSDTCTMDGEELVLEFVDQRSLITLGWIHTHPSQSCFMSSVDLHTHSGFQQMLPEFVAVVCAPKSNPNFGIFRLTDPPGLPTILECKAKEAFHPHPDLPIYTDADKGHVHMRDAPLEIIDMR